MYICKLLFADRVAVETRYVEVDGGLFYLFELNLNFELFEQMKIVPPPHMCMRSSNCLDQFRHRVTRELFRSKWLPSTISSINSVGKQEFQWCKEWVGNWDFSVDMFKGYFAIRVKYRWTAVPFVSQNLMHRKIAV